MKYTVFGLQRSGTNWIEQCIKQNFKEMNLANTDKQYIWKHKYDFEPALFGEDRMHLYVIKEPYMWIESILRKNVDVAKRYPEVLKDNKNKFDLGPFDIQKLANLWSEHTIWWHQEHIIERSKIHRVEYESLLQPGELDKLLFMLKKKYDLKMNHFDSTFKNPHKVGQSDQWNEGTRMKYLNKELHKLTWEHIQYINERLTDKALSLTSYRRIDNLDNWKSRKA